MDSDRQLKRAYLRFNRRFFGGQLPHDTVVYWQPLSGDDGASCPVWEVAHNKFVITIDPRWSASKWVWQMILIHECAHLHLWRKSPRHQHGKVFQQEMLRLAMIGAFKGVW